MAKYSLPDQVDMTTRVSTSAYGKTPRIATNKAAMFSAGQLRRRPCALGSALVHAHDDQLTIVGRKLLFEAVGGDVLA